MLKFEMQNLESNLNVLGTGSGRRTSHGEYGDFSGALGQGSKSSLWKGI